MEFAGSLHGALQRHPEFYTPMHASLAPEVQAVSQALLVAAADPSRAERLAEIARLAAEEEDED